MAADPVPFLRGRRMRGTRVDACGRPVPGPCAQVTTSGFIQVEMSPEVEEGEETTQRNAAGELAIAEKGPDEIKWYTAEVQFCAVDPDLVTIINPTWRKILDAQGRTVGWAENGKLQTDTGFALELWMDTASGDTCDDPDSAGSWGYLLLPFLTGIAPGDLTIENGAVTFTLNGMTKKGSRWGVGPYPVQLDVAGEPTTLLAPVLPNEQRLFFRTEVPPPAAKGGCQALTLPAAPTITGVTKDDADATGKTAEVAFAPGAPGNTVSIAWGDGNTTANAVTPATHAYAQNGAYTITVRDMVTGGIAQQTVTIPFP